MANQYATDLATFYKNDTKLKQNFIKRKNPIKVAIWMANQYATNLASFKMTQVKGKIYKKERSDTRWPSPTFYKMTPS